MAIDLSKDNFESTVKGSDKPVVIKAFAVWCGPCQQLAPIYEEVEKDNDGKAVFTKLDVDNAQELAMELGISSVPTIIFYKDAEIVGKEVGYLSKDDLQSKLDAFLQ